LFFGKGEKLNVSHAGFCKTIVNNSKFKSSKARVENGAKRNKELSGTLNDILLNVKTSKNYLNRICHCIYHFAHVPKSPILPYSIL
jgi:hypothetical protein